VDHADAAAAMALDAVDVVGRVARELDTPLEVRVGLHSGSVVAGVIGRHKFAYDLWGDNENLAARMESHGVPGAVQITDDTRARLRGDYEFEARDAVDVKGKGPMRTWLITRRA
jgi:class 3 adenylate cyclase